MPLSHEHLRALKQFAGVLRCLDMTSATVSTCHACVLQEEEEERRAAEEAEAKAKREAERKERRAAQRAQVIATPPRANLSVLLARASRSSAADQCKSESTVVKHPCLWTCNSRRRASCRAASTGSFCSAQIIIHHCRSKAGFLTLFCCGNKQLKKEGKLLSGKQKAEAERLAKVREQMLANSNMLLPGAPPLPSALETLHML